MFYKISKTPQGKYYPQSVTRGKTISTRKVAQELALISTVSEADARAVLSMLGQVMSKYLADGRSVKLDGLGSFRLTGYTGQDNKAVDDPKQVTSKMFKGVRVRFIPEAFQQTDGTLTKAMTSGEISWIKLTEEEAEASEDDSTTDDGSTSDGGTSGGGDSDDDNLMG
ncbi:MAG: HU family DNA-binding protein [Bacteroides sp.]